MSSFSILWTLSCGFCDHLFEQGALALQCVRQGQCSAGGASGTVIVELASLR